MFAIHDNYIYLLWGVGMSHKASQPPSDDFHTGPVWRTYKMYTCILQSANISLASGDLISFLT